MQLITQTELATHLDLTPARVGQLLKQGIFAIQDTEHKLLDRDYCAYRYKEFQKNNIGHIERHREAKEQKLYDKAKIKLETELRAQLNDAFDIALPLALETYKTDYEYSEEQLEEIKDGVEMFYSEFLKVVTGDGLSTYDLPSNPEIINERNRGSKDKILCLPENHHGKLP